MSGLSSLRSNWMQQIGPLRWFIALLVIVVTPCAFMQDLNLTSPWDIIVHSIMPGLALFLIWAIPLDVLMANVFKADADDLIRARYRTVIRFDSAVWLLMLATWGYFFLGLIVQR